MKNILLGIIFGIILASAVTVNANYHNYTDFEERVVELLEELIDHGEDISSDTQTLINSVSRLPQG